MNDDLCYLTADEAIAAFASGTLSPVELMEAVIARAESVQDRLKPFTYTHFDQALEAARASEERYRRGEPIGPLDGLPVGIKDESYIEDWPTSNGSLIMEEFVADKTSENNRRIMDAGGIPHARTATPEFSCSGVTWSRLWGTTRNPWNPDYTPGGSSGGAGASLAAGSSTLCTGSDIGGSIRIPASACGLVGFKPPYGRNTDDPPFNLDFYCHTGPLARSVRDAARLQNVMSGPSDTDLASLRPKLVLPSEFDPIKGWKIAYSPDLSAFEIDPEVRTNTENALDVFRSLGAEVEEVDLGWSSKVLEAGLSYLHHLFGGWLSTLLEEHGDKMTPYCRALAERGQHSSRLEFLKSLEVANEMYASLGPLLARCNVLICPTNAIPAVTAEHDQSKDRVTINGKEVDPLLGWVLTTPFNTLSRCPVLTVPSGFASSGIPTGIQIVGRTYSDADVFQAGLAYETACGGWFRSPESRPSL